MISPVFTHRRRTSLSVDLELGYNEGENYIPYDLTGCTLLFTIKHRTTDSDDVALVKVELTDHIAPLEGKTRFEVSANELNLTPKDYFFDCKIINPGAPVGSGPANLPVEFEQGGNIFRIYDDVSHKTV